MNTALYGSVIVTMLALFVFDFIKGKITGLNPLRGGLQTVLVGGLAAGVALMLARWLGSQSALLGLPNWVCAFQLKLPNKRSTWARLSACLAWSDLTKTMSFLTKIPTLGQRLMKTLLIWALNLN
jgi:hypothetical protein